MDREKAIKGLEHCTNHDFDCFYMDGCPYDNGTCNVRLCLDNLMRDALELLKTQRAVEGRWDIKYIENDEPHWGCSVCGDRGGTWPGDTPPPFEYCPHCGARIKGTEELDDKPASH